MTHLFVEFVRFALAATFALSAGSKLLVFNAFADSLRAYGLPRRLLVFTAAGVVGTEGALVVILIVSDTAIFAALLSAVAVLLLFSAALAKNLFSGASNRSTCYCFGIRARPVSWLDLCRNGGLILMAVGAVFGILRVGNGADVGANSLVTGPSTGTLLIASSGAFFALIWSRLGDFIELVSEQ